MGFKSKLQRACAKKKRCSRAEPSPCALPRPDKGKTNPGVLPVRSRANCRPAAVTAAIPPK